MRWGQFVNCSWFVVYNAKNVISEDNDLAELKVNIYIYMKYFAYLTHRNTTCTFQFFYYCLFLPATVSQRRTGILLYLTTVSIFESETVSLAHTVSLILSVSPRPPSLTNWAHLQLEIPRCGPARGGQSGSRHQTEMTITTTTTIITITTITTLTTLTTLTTISFLCRSLQVSAFAVVFVLRYKMIKKLSWWEQQL